MAAKKRRIDTEKLVAEIREAMKDSEFRKGLRQFIKATTS